MSVLRRGIDEKYHYSDNSHRWIAPTAEEQPGWEIVLRAHMEEHRNDFTSHRLGPFIPPRSG